MFDFLKPRKHVVAPQRPTVNIARLTAGALRQGMWVAFGNKIGIIKDMDAQGIVLLMVTDSDGNNVIEMQVPAAELRQAKRSELPKKRVGHLSKQQLESMGYV